MAGSERKAPPGGGDVGPDEIRRSFGAVAMATDTPPPGDGSRLLTVNLSQPISTLARTVGSILHAAPVFRLGEGVVTVNDAGAVAPMTPERFTSWVESYLAFTRPAKDAPAVESIGKDLAGKILAADQFREHVRELKGISEVRLPVWRGDDAARTVELASPGYDAGSGVLTLDLVPFDEEWEVVPAWSFLRDQLESFPFEAEGVPKIVGRRSYAAQVAGMVGVFCRLLFPEGTPVPLVLYNANQPGSGKSLLMRLALAPVFGPPAEAGKPDTEAEFEKMLDSAAIARKPYLVLDDCNSIHSRALNRFVTSPVHECRLMHSQRMATVPKVTQVFATGNGLTVSPDLERRALIVDLFEAGEAATRSFAHEITPGWLFRPEMRGKFLAALWSLVRAWRDVGMPLLAEYRRASFEEWTALVGGIVTNARLANPFGPRQVAVGGDEAGRALQTVLARLVGEASREIPPTLVIGEILDRAEADGLLDSIVGFARDPRKSLGHKLRNLRGRHLMDSQGRAFEFGRRDVAAGAKYPVRFLES